MIYSVELEIERKKPYLIGIPVISNIHFIEECLASIDYDQVDVALVNNSINEHFVNQINALAVKYNVTVVQQPKNIGVAAAWNVLMRAMDRCGYLKLLISNSDVTYPAGVLKQAFETDLEDDGSITCVDRSFCSFIVTPQTIEAIGYFDENFYPAYFEDNDFGHRIKLAGKRIQKLGLKFEHRDSTTIKNDRIFAVGNSVTFPMNQAYYQRKWGGGPGREKSKNPFGNPENDIKHWVEPSQLTVDGKDWENIAAKKKLSRPEPSPYGSLREILSRYNSDKNTTHAYGPLYEGLLAEYKDTATNILEIGAGPGAMYAWRDYFTSATIHTVNTSNKKLYNNDRIRQYVCKQTDRPKLKEYFEDIQFDIIIDDGTHSYHDQILSYVYLQQFLKPGGIYIIEDIQSEDTLEYLSIFDIEVFDLRNQKDRYDDLVAVIRKPLTT